MQLRIVIVINKDYHFVINWIAAALVSYIQIDNDTDLFAMTRENEVGCHREVDQSSPSQEVIGRDLYRIRGPKEPKIVYCVYTWAVIETPALSWRTSWY